MAEPLKNVYNKSFIEEVAIHCKAVIPTFNKEAFLKNCLNSEWDNMELKQRMRHISLCLDQQLTGNYNKDVATLAEIAKHIIKTTGKKNTFEYLFLPDLIERKGAQYTKASLDAIEHITKLSSCEFAIRPIIATNPDQAMKTLLNWAKNRDTSVRRLSSEGCRPRLPWGMALQEFKKDPAPILPILDILKNDSSEYVRRSVANNLNDIAKDNPEIAISLFNKWKGISPEVDKLLKHGSRTLLKQGHTEILALFGTGLIPTLNIEDVKVAFKTIKIGEDQRFAFSFSHHEKSNVKIRVEYAVYYLKANGSYTKKVFKISENTYNANTTYTLNRKQSFRNLTTRRHYEGKHYISVILNGTESKKQEFEITM